MRSRSVVNREEAGTYYNYGVPEKMYVNASSDTGTLWSDGHWGYPNFPPDSDVGGNFGSLFTRCSTSSSDVAVMGGYTAYVNHHYIGKVYGPPQGSNANPGLFDAAAWGPQAYSMMKPTKPTFNGLNSIYELRELPGQLRERFLDKGADFRKIGNYWLALKFGWEPLLRDIQSCITFQRDAQKKLGWLMRNNGKTVRTRCNLASNESGGTPTVTNGNGPTPSFVDYFYKSRSLTRTQTITDKVWASAHFKYWLPPGPQDVNWTRAMMMRLFGLYPSPSVVWKALPWTWLIDWFHTAGTVLQNMDAGVANRCAASNFYVMRERMARDVCVADAVYYSYPDGKPLPVSVESHREWGCRTRLKGDPFGFHSNPNDLSGMQLSILGALGLSKL